MQSLKNNKKTTLAAIVFFAILFLVIGIFTIKAQDQTINSDDQELQLIQKLTSEELKLESLVDEIEDVMVFAGTGGTNGIFSDISSNNGIDDNLAGLQYALEWKIDDKVPLSQQLFFMSSMLETVLGLTNVDSPLVSRNAEISNIISSLENLFNSQNANKIARVNSATKTLLYKASVNDQPRFLKKIEKWSDNDSDQQISRIGRLGYLNDKLDNLKKYLSQISDYIDKNQGICRLNQDRLNECSNIVNSIKTIVPALDDITGKLGSNVHRIQSLTNSFNQLESRPSSNLEGDLTGDGKVDIFDLVTVAKNFGKKI
ncbi:MAG TPA: hypothetical protein VJB63_03330 [Patescibacteria group bacterium]|nr:hypothetical protein [Patescibacteria group bacterium]